MLVDIEEVVLLYQNAHYQGIDLSELPNIEQINQDEIAWKEHQDEAAWDENNAHFFEGDAAFDRELKDLI